MRNFSELTNNEVLSVEQRFVLPSDRSQLQVSNNLVPFERISGVLVGCTVINTNFHIHELKNR